jgi:hypothetical protein
VSPEFAAFLKVKLNLFPNGYKTRCNHRWQRVREQSMP